MLRYTLGGLVVTAALALFAACGDSGETIEGLCEPGSEVFCKCRGGFEGTKTCQEDGNSFGDCTTPEGSCPSIEETTTTGDPTTSSTTGGGGGGGTGDKALLEPCAGGGECQSGQCESGFCTQPCVNYRDCPEGDADCVLLPGGAQVCAPYCTKLDDCTQYGAESACGGAQDIEGLEFYFAVCAFWGEDLFGMPEGTPCDDVAGTITYGGQEIAGTCYLGQDGLQDVCAFGQCAKGCYDDLDCPAMDCLSTGSIDCCASEPDCE